MGEFPLKGGEGEQILSLREAQYIMEFILQQMKKLAMSIQRDSITFDVDRPVVAIQYVHADSHALKELGKKFGILVVFKYGNKLEKLPARVDRSRAECGKSGHEHILDCVDNVVYSIPLSCGSSYVGQSGRCINKRLYEHKKACESNKAVSSVSLIGHLRKCEGCTPIFGLTEVTARNGNKRVREILEASQIINGGSSVVSKVSINLSKEEREFIEKDKSKVEITLDRI